MLVKSREQEMEKQIRVGKLLLRIFTKHFSALQPHDPNSFVSTSGVQMRPVELIPPKITRQEWFFSGPSLAGHRELEDGISFQTSSSCKEIREDKRSSKRKKDAWRDGDGAQGGTFAQQEQRPGFDP